MLQVISISHARNNLSKLVKSVKETKEPVIIVQDSSPAVVISAYEEDSVNNRIYLSKLKNIKGDWFSLKEFKKTRQELNKRFTRDEKTSS